MRSRPRRVPCTSPACASTWRCFVTAWRVTPAPALNAEIEAGPPVQSRDTRRSRVASPSAANTGAECFSAVLAPAALRRLVDMLLDVPHLLVPAAAILTEGLRALVGRNMLEAALDDGQHRAFGSLLERACHQRRRLVGVVLARLHGAGNPAPREEPLRLHAVDHDVEPEMRVCGMPDRSRHARARRERALHVDA